jgi:hypothetical protein
METLQQTYHTGYGDGSRQSIISRFIAWCESQQKHQYGWLAAILAAHGCVITPITVLCVAMGSNSIALWATAIGAMGASLITNLAALPTKITIPVFVTSIFIDIVIIAISIGSIVSA